MVASLFRQLTSGLQDERLTYGDGKIPTWSQFTKVFRRAGRMTTRWHRVDFNQVPGFGKTVICDLPLKGEFISRIILVSTLPNISTVQSQANIAAQGAGGELGDVVPKFGWANSIGHTLVQETQFIIGGNTVETIDRRLLEVLDEFNTPLEKVTVMNRLLGRADNGFTQTTFGYTGGAKTVYAPLPFWFCRGESAVALPRDAISLDVVRVQVSFAPFSDMYVTDSKQLPAEDVGSDDCGGTTEVIRRGVTPRQFINCGGTKQWQFEGTQFYYPCVSGEIIEGLDVTGPVCPVPVTAPDIFQLGDTYLLVEYIYVDKPEANRFRLGDIQVPVLNHRAIPAFDTQGLMSASIAMRFGNPIRNLFWMCQRVEVGNYNDHFSCSRELVDPAGNYWWPNAVGLSALAPGPLRPAWSDRDTEPLAAVQLLYEGNLQRVGSRAPAFFRSILPSLECKKAPWIHRYMYYYGFGWLNNARGASAPCGEANADKLYRMNLQLEFAPLRGYSAPTAVPRYNVYVWGEMYNVLRVYGGRAGLLFDY